MASWKALSCPTALPSGLSYELGRPHRARRARCMPRTQAPQRVVVSWTPADLHVQSFEQGVRVLPTTRFLREQGGASYRMSVNHEGLLHLEPRGPRPPTSHHGPWQGGILAVAKRNPDVGRPCTPLHPLVSDNRRYRLLMPGSVAEIVGAAAGGCALLVIVVGLLFFCIFYWGRTEANRSSETGSSDPSNLVECRRDRRSFVDYSLANEHHVARRFTLEELEEATKNFSQSNLVGTGSFGLVYKGLLLDGTIVAIKRHAHVPRLAFVEEVKNLSKIRHRNLVTLIGYCQEGGLQMLVYEYLPNGSITQHLYYNEHHSLTNLEFKQRLTVAIGAAKGLTHLHSLAPPLVHKNFKTSNILVDENFIAKVADAGILKLLQGSQEVQHQGSKNAFQDPVARELGRFSEASDVYSFGVFLLELISGIDIERCISPDSYNILAHWVEAHVSSNDLIDRRLGNGFTSQGMKELIALTLQCLNPSGQSRPWMSSIVTVLDRILETEMTLTTIMGDGTAIVTLGSQLFT
ncbi:PTI1-like tyrosine-protein kinase At3g15890 isoform X2 [Zingiber officinale]|uniref:PTI1-like tyrosine-protein kinase At3g15890 isoform X2 n=2 Tax=Zingiber officinale TaxID=94328 RepID=UPI001C4BAE1E|nr:PTI1-like tyrosine-protein kinase At3g15890 isoform X2 [Zingiber officinale]